MYRVAVDHPDTTIDHVVIVSPLAEWTEAYLIARRRAYARYNVAMVLDNHEEYAVRASRIALVLGMRGQQLLSGVSVHRAACLHGIDLPSAVMLEGLGLQWSVLTPGTIELSGTMRGRLARRQDVEVMLEVAVSAICLFGADAVGTAPPHMVPRYGKLGFFPCPHLPKFEYPETFWTMPMVMRDPIGMPGCDEDALVRMMGWRENLRTWVPEGTPHL